MTNETSVQPGLAELMAGFLRKQAEAKSVGITTIDGEVTPHEVGPVQPLDPKLAWDEAQAVLTFHGSAAARRHAPPHWSMLVAGHESIVAIAFCAGNFPQLMRNFHTILTQPDLTQLRPTAGREAVADGLASWCNDIAQKQAFPQMLLALGTMRLARHFAAADAFVAEHDTTIPSEWRAAWENEKASLAWHRGQDAAARAIWDKLEPTAPVLFNRGMSTLFAGDRAAAKRHLSAAVAKLPATSAWHHLAQLYRTLADLPR